MRARQRIVRIGNSRGVRLSSQVLAEAGLAEGDEVEIRAEAGQVIVRPIRQPRSGWGEQFARMAQAGDDRLLDEEIGATSVWDETDWEW